MAHESFLVAGLGTFGAQTAITLCRGGADVLAIDRDDLAVDAVKDSVTKAVCCDATDLDAMRAVGAFDLTTAIVAIRRRFDVTVLVTHMLAREKFDRILVQVDTDKEAEAIRAVGATEVIFPERDMAQRIAERLLNPSLADQVPLGENFSLLEVTCPREFAGQSLIDLDLRKSYGLMLIATKLPAKGSNKREQVHVAPAPDQPLKVEENLLLVGTRKQLLAFKTSLGLS